MNNVKPTTSGLIHFGFDHVGAKPNDKPWITVSWVDAAGYPLVLLVDNREKNEGVSLTNAMESAIAMLAPYVENYKQATFVQMDSGGQFDLVKPVWEFTSPTWKGGPLAPEVNWIPLRSGEHFRSIEAFKSFAGEYAEELVSKIDVDFTPSAPVRAKGPSL